MKTRNGFVSNSSSSSFVCNLCNKTEVTWEGIDDVDMYECENGHTVCNECHPLPDDVDIEDDGLLYEVPEKYCPICQFIHPSHQDISQYFERKYKISKDVVLEEVKKLNKRRKKLYDSEYVQYVCKQHGIDLYELLKELKSKHKTYSDFKVSIKTMNCNQWRENPTEPQK